MKEIIMMVRAIYNEGYSLLDQLVQEEIVRRLFPRCSTQIYKNTLLVDCVIQDEDYKDIYHIRIQYESQQQHQHQHQVFILSPKICPSIAIHMYPNGSLCLYYPPDISPFRRLWVAKDLIPMTALWVCHYEQWLINGNVWKGREAPGHEALLRRVNSKV